MKYKIEFFDYWHTSSGLSTGSDADTTVIKDEDKLPIIQGKTLKGLIREAAENLHELDSSLVTKEFIKLVFGEQILDNDKQEKSVKEATCFFSNAMLSKKTVEFLNTENDKNLKSALYKNIASTKIDENGQAKEHSLRVLEVCIPLVLYAEIVDFPDDKQYEEQLKLCLNWVKRMGLNRTRGLGRCKLEII